MVGGPRGQRGQVVVPIVEVAQKPVWDSAQIHHPAMVADIAQGIILKLQPAMNSHAPMVSFC